jgi:hypothetical protein
MSADEEMFAVDMDQRAGLFVELCRRKGAEIGSVAIEYLAQFTGEDLPLDRCWVLLGFDSEVQALAFIVEQGTVLKSPRALAAIFEEFGQPKLLRVGSKSMVLFPSLYGEAVPLP